jgi:thiamine pyrophosphokinase
MPRTLIFANGELPDLEKARALLRADDYIVCADGGTQHALALGLKPNVIVGDLDSLRMDVQSLKEQGIEIILYPHDKDETDLELAISHALQEDPSSILIVAGLGFRLDHTLGNISLLADARLSSLDCRLDDGLDEAFFCRGRSEVRGRSGDLVSLIPWGRAVEGVRTEGLKWPLRAETLYPEKSRGISNELLGDVGKIQIATGLLLVIHHRQSPEI